MRIIEEDYNWSGPLERFTSPVEELILHHAAVKSCTARDIHRQHLQNGWRGIAYHYFVRKDGSIYRGRPEDAVGGHTAGHNHKSLGICFEGNFDLEEMGPVQKQAGSELVADILIRYPDIRVMAHREAGATACPGSKFPLEELKEGSMSYEQFKDYMERYMEELRQQEPSEWSREARAWAEEQGIIRGDEQGRKQYKKPLTREEYVQIAYRQAQ